jgi:hypothetical protein
MLFRRKTNYLSKFYVAAQRGKETFYNYEEAASINRLNKFIGDVGSAHTHHRPYQPYIIVKLSALE